LHDGCISLFFISRSERDLKQQMEAINKAAQAAVATDLDEHAGLFYSSVRAVLLLLLLL
jgi:hypothetical protein